MPRERRHVLMGIPTTSTNPKTVTWLDAYMGIEMPLGSAIARSWAGRDDITIADKRERFLDEAIDGNFKFLFMLGDDVIPPRNVVASMLSRIGQPHVDAEGRMVRADMLTGVYWTKSYPTTPYLWRDLLVGAYTDWQAGEVFSVDFAGCDCLLIDIDAFLAADIERPWFSHDWDWDGEPVQEINTEDFFFYTKTRQAGLRVFCDSSIQCLHEDRQTGHQFGLLQDMRQAGGTPMGAEGDVIADIGSGTDSFSVDEGATLVRFDRREDVRPDVRCDITRIPPHHFGLYDRVMARHVLEHFDREQGHHLVRHWCRLLKPGGEIMIDVPNLAWACRVVLADEPTPDLAYALGVLWGGQKYSLDYHYNGFTARKLFATLASVPELEDIEVVEITEGVNLKATARLARPVEPLSIKAFWRRELGYAEEDRGDGEVDGDLGPERTGGDGGRVAAAATGGSGEGGPGASLNGEAEGEKQKQKSRR